MLFRSSDFVHIADKAFTEDEFDYCQNYLLQVLDYNVYLPITRSTTERVLRFHRLHVLKRASKDREKIAKLA